MHIKYHRKRWYKFVDCGEWWTFFESGSLKGNWNLSMIKLRKKPTKLTAEVGDSVYIMGMSWLLKSYVRLLYKLWRNLYSPKQNSVWFWTFPKLKNRGEIMLVIIPIRSKPYFRWAGCLYCLGVFSWSLVFSEGNDPPSLG